MEEKPKQYFLHYHGDYSLLYDFLIAAEFQIELTEEIKKQYWVAAGKHLKLFHKEWVAAVKTKEDKAWLKEKRVNRYKSNIARHFVLDKWYDENIRIDLNDPTGKIVKPISFKI